MKYCLKKLNLDHYIYHHNNSNSESNNQHPETNKKQLLSTEKAMKT